MSDRAAMAAMWIVQLMILPHWYASAFRAVDYVGCEGTTGSRVTHGEGGF